MSREIQTGDALTQEELDLLVQNGITLKQLHYLLGVTNAKMTLEAAIGGVLNMKKAFEEEKEVADPRGLGIDPLKEEVEAKDDLKEQATPEMTE